MKTLDELRHVPLAERIRPQRLHQILGQSHLLGEGAPLQKMIAQGEMISAIFWGRPGTGKTTLARVIAGHTTYAYVELSATMAGVADIRKVIDLAQEKKVLLFLDEIHRFNKSQQDILLPIVESGAIVLIGATTENPSFEVNKALLSRMHVFEIKPLQPTHLRTILEDALSKDVLLKTLTYKVESTDTLIDYAQGDARKMLGIVDMLTKAHPTTDTPIVISNETISQLLQKKIAQYDKTGEDHYDTISALIKSIRGSDPNAALYWLARMLDAGEEVLFIARRLIISAAEDIGLANPNALMLANATWDSVHKLGMPEARIPLSSCVVYLATSPKSNAAYVAIDRALALVRTSPAYPVPLHLRNAPTSLMKTMGYGKGYQYAHDFDKNFVVQDYLPTELRQTVFYEPQSNPREQAIQQFLEERWGKK